VRRAVPVRTPVLVEKSVTVGLAAAAVGRDRLVLRAQKGRRGGGAGRRVASVVRHRPAATLHWAEEKVRVRRPIASGSLRSSTGIPSGSRGKRS